MKSLNLRPKSIKILKEYLVKKISIILYGQCSKSIVNIDINEQTGLHQTKKVSMCQNKQQMQKTAHELEENPQ